MRKIRPLQRKKNKRAPSIVLHFFLLCVFLFGCTFSSDYKRSNVIEVIKRICKDEYQLDVIVWDVGQTIWVYAPLKLLDDQGQWRFDKAGHWDEDVRRDQVNLYDSLRRVLLNLDHPPQFYCLIQSNIENVGLDWYQVTFLPDLMKFELLQKALGPIPTEEINERTFSWPIDSPQAIGDRDGNHIQTYDMTMGEFVSYLIKQSLYRQFTAPEVKDNFKINNLRTYYFDKRLGVIFDIMIIKHKPGLPDPFIEAKKITKKFIEIYHSKLGEDIVEIEINDTFRRKRVLLSQGSILADD